MPLAELADGTVANVTEDSVLPYGPATPIPQGQEAAAIKHSADLEGGRQDAMNQPRLDTSSIGGLAGDLAKSWGKNIAGELYGTMDTATMGMGTAAAIGAAEAVGADSLANTLREAFGSLRETTGYKVGKLHTIVGTGLVSGAARGLGVMGAGEALGARGIGALGAAEGAVEGAAARVMAPVAEGAASRSLALGLTEEMVPSLEAIGQSSRAAQLARSAVTTGAELGGYSGLSRLGENLEELAIENKPLTVASAMAGVPEAGLLGFVGGAGLAAAGPSVAKLLARGGKALEEAGARAASRLRGVSEEGSAAAKALGIKASSAVDAVAQAERVYVASEKTVSSVVRQAAGSRLTAEQAAAAMDGMTVDATAKSLADKIATQEFGSAIKSAAKRAVAEGGSAAAWERQAERLDVKLSKMSSEPARKVGEDAVRRMRGAIADSIDAVGMTDAASAYRQAVINRKLAGVVSEAVKAGKGAEQGAASVLGEFARSAAMGAASSALGMGPIGAALNARKLMEVAAKSAMAAGFGRKLGAIAEVMGSAVSTQQRAQRAIDAFVTGSTRMYSGARKSDEPAPKARLTRQSYELARARADYLTSEQHSVAVQGYLNKYADTAPQVAAQILQNYMVASQALRARLPQDQSPTGAKAMSSLSKVPRSHFLDMAEHKFIREAEVIADPMKLLERLKDGTLSKDEVLAVKEAHPIVYDNWVQMIMRTVQDHRAQGKSMSMGSLCQLSILTETPLTPMMEPDFISTVQATFIPPEPPKPPSNEPPVDRNSISQSPYSTPTEEVETQ